MGWNGWLMSKPIGMGDISTAVGYSSLDLGTLVAKGSIKKWALHKSVRLQSNYDTPTDISEYNTWISYMQNKVAKADGTGSAPYGLTVGTSTNIYDLFDDTVTSADWKYEQPPETGTFWRRMLDFNGYTNAPNTPFNKLDAVFTFNRQASENVLIINTNQGEAGETSIPINAFSTLDNYWLMLAVKGYSNWWVTVMPTTIMRSIEEGQTVINFSLPSSTSIDLNTASGHDAYLVGIRSDPQDSTKPAYTAGTWHQLADSVMRNTYSMIPLPFAEKADGHFKFKVRENPNTDIVNYSYVLYLTQSYVLKKIEFRVSIYRNVSPPTTFRAQFDTLKVYPDWDYQHTSNYPLTNITFLFGGGSGGQTFSYNSNTQLASASQIIDVSSFNYTLDAYPELTFNKSNTPVSGTTQYGWQDNGYEVVYIDD